MAKNSIKDATALALGISPAYIPEGLRNKLNGYVKSGTIPSSMIDGVPLTSESHVYTPKPIISGNQTYLRNIVYLDTLFDQPKVVRGLITNTFDEKQRSNLLADLQKLNAAKLETLKSMLPVQDEIIEFLKREDIDWNTEQLPYPFEGGPNASPLIAANLSLASDLSIYDQTLKCFLNKDYRKAYDLVQENPAQFLTSDTSLLSIIINQKYAEYQEYAEYTHPDTGPSRYTP